MKANYDLSGRMYKQGSSVYIGYTPIRVHDQRGRKYVNYKGRQVNLNDIPLLPQLQDPVFDYIFNGLSAMHPCHAMDYWIRRHRLKQDIRPWQYKAKYINRIRA